MNGGADLRNIRPGALVVSEYPGDYYQQPLNYRGSVTTPGWGGPVSDMEYVSAANQQSTSVRMNGSDGMRRQVGGGGGPSADNFFRPVSPNGHIYMEIDPNYGKVLEQRRLNNRYSFLLK